MTTTKITRWFRWASNRPVVMMNLTFLILAVMTFLYLAIKPIDVLTDWSVNVVDASEYRDVNGERMAVYNPGDTIVFKSKSTKLVTATGNTTRLLVCDSVDGTKQSEIELALDTVPVGRPTGVIQSPDNGINIPEIEKFRGLPRVCRLTFDIIYTDVVLWRDHPEHAETQPFIVEKSILTPEEAEAKIKQLERQVQELKMTQSPSVSMESTQPNVASTAPASQPQSTPSRPSSPAPATVATPNTPQSAQDEPGLLTNLLNIIGIQIR